MGTSSFRGIKMNGTAKPAVRLEINHAIARNRESRLRETRPRRAVGSRAIESRSIMKSAILLLAFGNSVVMST